ncbi:MAG: hypothetical protein JO235_19380 [Chroococcidiopsidaceae cyanobacterium CP_BM_RX_35]|nr:hypothetical protein [Chroococcidiopsidaceae cyanobacterium CP_BM_RX_35]
MSVNKTGIASVLLFSGILALSVSPVRADTETGKQASTALTIATTTNRIASGTGVIAPNADARSIDSSYDTAQVNVTIPPWVGHPVYDNGGHYYWEDSQYRRRSIPPVEYQKYRSYYHWNGKNYDYHYDHRYFRGFLSREGYVLDRLFCS